MRGLKYARRTSAKPARPRPAASEVAAIRAAALAVAVCGLIACPNRSSAYKTEAGSAIS